MLGAIDFSSAELCAVQNLENIDGFARISSAGSTENLESPAGVSTAMTVVEMPRSARLRAHVAVAVESPSNVRFNDDTTYTTFNLASNGLSSTPCVACGGLSRWYGRWLSKLIVIESRDIQSPLIE